MSLHESDDSFFGLSTNIYEDLGVEKRSDKFEYILPEITIDKNLISDNRIGILDFNSTYKVHNYDTDKYTNFLVNNFNWNFKDISFIWFKYKNFR